MSDLNGTPATPEDYMAVWEAILDSEELLEWVKQGGGQADARSYAEHLTLTINNAWGIAHGEGYDDCFDWEFVPAALQLIYKSDDGLTADSIAHRILREWTAENEAREASQAAKDEKLQRLASRALMSLYEAYCGSEASMGFMPMSFDDWVDSLDEDS
jgi:hypothetical protein